jgi:xanthine dehydrogenase accessory factor
VPSVLVTVLQVEGSAPREPGASLLVTAGDVVGSIGGGRLEHAAIARARAMLESGCDVAVVERHALGPGLGQCCGGAVTLRTAPLGADAKVSAWYRALVGARMHGEVAVLVTIVANERDDPRVGTRVVVTADGVHPPSGLADEIVATARARLASPEGGAVLVRIDASLVVLIEPDLDAHHVVVFGAGHVGRALVPILATLPGRVVWVDSRAEAFPSPPPAGVDCRVTPVPEDEVDVAPPGASFVVLTHDHALDLRLAEAILARDDVGYFGLIGSVT